MILVCPSCMARYRVKVEALGATGRRVKCTRCSHVWHAEPPEHQVEIVHAELEVMPPSDIPEPRRPPPRAQLPVPASSVRRRRRQSLWTWVACFLVLALCLVGYEARQAIAKEWPWLAPVYEALGIAVGEGQGAQPGRPE